MTEDKPIACSLGAGALEQRLAAIAEIGNESLTSHEVDGDRHRLRFRADAESRQQLGEIVAAEAECCSFLDLSLTEEDGELVLSIGAPDAGRAVADGLAATFTGARLT